jgi:hypothetical protein
VATKRPEFRNLKRISKRRTTMTRETTIRTLSGNELENVIGGAKIPRIRLNPPVGDGGGRGDDELLFESREVKG